MDASMLEKLRDYEAKQMSPLLDSFVKTSYTSALASAIYTAAQHRHRMHLTVPVSDVTSKACSKHRAGHYRCPLNCPQRVKEHSAKHSAAAAATTSTSTSSITSSSSTHKNGASHSKNVIQRWSQAETDLLIDLCNAQLETTNEIKFSLLEAHFTHPRRQQKSLEERWRRVTHRHDMTEIAQLYMGVI